MASDFFRAFVLFRDDKCILCLQLINGFHKAACLALFSLGLCHIPAHLDELRNFRSLLEHEINLPMMDVFPIEELKVCVESLPFLEFQKHDIFCQPAEVFREAEPDCVAKAGVNSLYLPGAFFLFPE